MEFSKIDVRPNVKSVALGVGDDAEIQVTGVFPDDVDGVVLGMRIHHHDLGHLAEPFHGFFHVFRHAMATVEHGDDGRDRQSLLVGGFCLLTITCRAVCHWLDGEVKFRTMSAHRWAGPASDALLESIGWAGS